MYLNNNAIPTMSEQIFIEQNFPFSNYRDTRVLFGSKSKQIVSNMMVNVKND